MVSSDVKIQTLEDLEDFNLLVPGDVVATGKVGPLLDGPMLVSKDSTRDAIILIQRYTPESIYKIRLTSEQVNLENGLLRFDFKKGKRISVWANYDWVYYDCYMKELERAKLE